MLKNKKSSTILTIVLFALAAVTILFPLQKEIPVLTSNGYWGADGKFYSVDDKNSPYYDLIQEYAMLQYNDMTDYKNRVEDFFELKQ